MYLFKLRYTKTKSKISFNN